MNSIFKQTARMGRLTTVLGPDALVLMRFSGSEALSALFDYEVDCLAASPDIDFDALTGTHATVTLITRDGGERPFDGIVTEARWLGAGENGHRYRLVLKPWFWLATLRHNQRIFHDRNVTGILDELLSAYADAGRLDIRTTAEYPALEYTVQYRESDFAFACRMMERFGISYHFTHSQGSHVMVLSDGIDAHPVAGRFPFRPHDGHHQEEVEHFHTWRPARRITTGAVRLTDYNFKTPAAAMEAEQAGDAAHAQGGIESFLYPGGYPDQTRGQLVARLRTGQARGQDRRIEAMGDIPALGAGCRVGLSGDPVPGTGGEFICLAAEHSYTSNSYGSGGGGDDHAYSGNWVLMPSDAPLMPERKTPRATVAGPQTAVVVGEGEIDCDEYGRILVRFHWDLEGAHSMRCRVSQSWSGNGWGGMVIPRIGMEVVVEFLEGDPDQPLVTGCVYNGKNAVPYELPEHKTRSTFRSKTHQGQGFNELRFEDKAGEEEIFVHAQKDRNEKVRNNHTERIDNNWVQSVGNNKIIDVDGHHDEVVSGQKSLHIGGSRLGTSVSLALKLIGDGISDVAKKLAIPGLADAKSGVFHITVEKLLNIVTLGFSNETVGVTKNISAGRSINLSAGHTVTVDACRVLALSGNSDTSISSSGMVSITCGDSSIMLGANGDIYLQGKNLYIDMENHIEANAGGALQMQAKKINLN